MDEIDAQIVEQLRCDARASYVDLGATVKLSPDAVRQRMERLIEDEELRILGAIEPEALGYRVLATVRILYRGDPMDFAEAMRPFECVTFIASTIGRTNMFCEIAAEHDGQLADFVATQIATIPGVVTFDTSKIVDVVKWKGIGWREQSGERPSADFESLDETDVQILRVLLFNPRIKITRLSERIGCPYQTTRRRVSALFDQGTIEAVAVTERVVPGKDALGLVLLESASREAWASGLADIPAIIIATRSFGKYAASLEIMSTSAHELMQVVDEISAFPGVKVAETLIYARSLVLPVCWRFPTRTL